MQEVLRALRADFAQQDAVNFESLNRAAIAGLLAQNAQTMQIVTMPAAPPAVPALKLEALLPGLACVRVPALRKEEAAALRTGLAALAGGETGALILDLRVPAADSDPALAAEFAALFLPKDTSVTATVKTGADPVWTRDLVVLVDTDTTNAGEVLAAVLQSQKRALLAGSTTRGRTAAVVELPVRKTDDGLLVLRYTAQRVKFPDGTADPFGKGLQPDLPAAFDAETKARVFALQEKEGLARTVLQKARPRSNEAALVAKSNPEIPERLARTAGQPTEYDAALTDRPLQLAVDVLTAQRVLGK